MTVSVNSVNIESLEFKKFEEIAVKDFLPILNKLKLREHLMKHELFDLRSAENWMQSKAEVDSINGCKIRAIYFKGQLIGWCGIQYENNHYEIAIVIDDNYWGKGVRVFREVMSWAKVFGHNKVYVHFLHTRPKYKFLQKLANQVYETELYGHKFTTYELDVWRT